MFLNNFPHFNDCQVQSCSLESTTYTGQQTHVRHKCASTRRVGSDQIMHCVSGSKQYTPETAQWIFPACDIHSGKCTYLERYTSGVRQVPRLCGNHAVFWNEIRSYYLDLSQCQEALSALATINEVTLVWVPGHHGILGNKMADKLAR
jgi:hypothetical protein